MSNKRKLSYDFVKGFISKKNCTLLSKKYINSKEKLLILCHCGREFKASYQAMRDHKNGCNHCARKRMGTRNTLEQLKESLKDKPCKLLSDYYIDDKTKLLFECECGNEFKREPRVVIHQKSYLCRECAYERMANAHRKTHKTFLKEVNELVGNEYYVLSEYKGAHQSIRMIHNSDICNNFEFDITPSSFLGGTRCDKCDKIQKTGEGHPRYNSNLTDSERLSRRDVLEVIKWREEVYKRDDYTCQVCNERSTLLNAHHLNSWDTHESERFDTDNGITLCEKCHIEFHKLYGYGNNTRKQFSKYMNLQTSSS